MDWVANVFVIIGTLLIGYKERIGFILIVFCNVIWVYIGYKKKMPALWFINAMMAILNIWNWFRWGP